MKIDCKYINPAFYQRKRQVILRDIAILSEIALLVYCFVNGNRDKSKYANAKSN